MNNPINIQFMPDLNLIESGMSLPNREDVLMYTLPVIDSIGLLSMVVISGSDQSDWILTLPDSDTVRAVLGINNDFYNASGVPLEMSWVELQTAADGNVYLFAGRKGTALYSVDMSADEALIMRVLGGLYVVPAAVLEMLDALEMLDTLEMTE